MSCEKGPHIPIRFTETVFGSNGMVRMPVEVADGTPGIRRFTPQDRFGKSPVAVMNERATSIEEAMQR